LWVFAPRMEMFFMERGGSERQTGNDGQVEKIKQ